MNKGAILEADVPILGEKIDRDAVKAVEVVLAKLKSGELVNVAVVAENVKTGLMDVALSVQYGDAMRVRGALGLLQTMLDRKMLDT